jgi:3-deoxy-D-manno-octulosonic-acid transferase
LFFIYTVLYIAALVFVFPFELLKRPRGKRYVWFREKFGVMPVDLNGSVWVHAVSVGEVMAAIPLVEKIRESGLGRTVVISTITDTGRRVAMERLPWAETVYLPFDIPWALEDAIRSLKPHAFILMETELWPNAVRSMKEAGVPVMVANGRISDKSFRNYRMARFFIGRVLRMMRAVCVQDELYAGRALALGAQQSLVRVTGNSKFDIDPGSKRIPAWVGRLGTKRPIIVAGSTHKGEEELVLSAANGLKSSFPGLALIIVPRHPERAREVGDIIKAGGTGFIYSSDIGTSGTEEPFLPDIIVVDGVGDLFGLYKFADVAIVCGSFTSGGGQNPLEPAYWAKPVVCGPGMGNFQFMPEMLAAGAAITAGKNTLQDIIKDLLSDPAKRELMGKKAREFYEGRAGASARTIEVLRNVLEGEDFSL